MSPSVESFNEAKYRALMDGLECSEIHFSQIDLKDRFDSDYYTKNYLHISAQMQKVPTKKLGKLANSVASAFYPAATQLYSEGDTAFARCVDCISYPIITSDQDSKFEKIPYTFGKENKGISFIHAGDIIITKVGTPCYASILTDYDEIALSRTVMGLTSIHDIDPYYLMIFLRCKYGFEQLYRQRELTIQYQLTLPRIKAIDVFLAGDILQKEIKKLCKKSKELLQESKKTYQSAEQSFMRIVSCPDFATASTYSIKRLNESFTASGRLDAEYYQPKYDKYLEQLRRFETTTISAEYDVFKNSGTNYADGISDVGVIKTKQLRNDGIDIDGVESYFDNQTCINNKSIFLKKNDVVFASMGVGSLGKVSIFSYDGEQKYVTDSTLRIYRGKPTCRIKPEVLSVFLQSQIGQELIYRYVVGSTGIINIYDDDMAKIPIPIFDDCVQSEIVTKVQESFNLRKQSKQLLEYAKQAVEIAIEHDEKKALEWLKEKLPKEI